MRLLRVKDIAYTPPEYIRDAIKRGDLWVIPEVATPPKSSGLDDDDVTVDDEPQNDVTQKKSDQHGDTSSPNATPEKGKP